MRDNLERAGDFISQLKIEEQTDLAELKKHFSQIQKGMEMTSHVMDATLKRYGVVQYDPKGEKFNPQDHEAVFTMQDPALENNTVGQVMQTGWKIGERVLRAAKVGVVKK